MSCEILHFVQNDKVIIYNLCGEAILNIHYILSTWKVELLDYVEQFICEMMT